MWKERASQEKTEKHYFFNRLRIQNILSFSITIRKHILFLSLLALTGLLAIFQNSTIVWYFGLAQLLQEIGNVPTSLGYILLGSHALISLYIISHMASVVFHIGQHRYNVVSNILRSLVAFVALTVVVVLPIVGEIIWYHEYGASLFTRFFGSNQDNDTQKQTYNTHYATTS